MAARAGHRSIEKPKCLHGTRVAILNLILGWVQTGQAQLFWLSSSVGIGKTTISLTIADYLDHNSAVLCASFFCSRDGDAENDARLIFPTLASQLAQRSASFRAQLDHRLSSCSEASELGHARPSEQLRKLILCPLQRMASDCPDIVLLIDGIDQCSNHESVDAVLKALVSHVATVPKIKLFISSRSNLVVRRRVGRSRSLTQFVLETVAPSQINEDIRTYVSHRTADTVSQLTLSETVSSHHISKLVRMSEGVFLYARELCEYIDCVDMWEKLKAVLDGHQHFQRRMHRLYVLILKSALQGIQDFQGRKECLRVLSTLIVLRSTVSVSVLAEMLCLEIRILRDHLHDLHPLLDLPDDNAGIIETRFHSSFATYVTSTLDLPAPFPHPLVTHRHISSVLLDVMASRLERVVSESDRFLKNSDLPGLPKQRKEFSDFLLYACTHWSHHLIQVSCGMFAEEDLDEIFSALARFAQTKLLTYLEVLSIFGLLGEAGPALNSVISWFDVRFLFFTGFLLIQR